ncbi:DUF418 domain-containing protein [Macrococcus equipercicus]|uniref:DUF418 domain-containing protein n=1 Tax=Macrococcus equipercicus TaxID=69967 RepID=A0A9Q9BPD6_9STAP|nr:DUF418 domain-containing protein [Macrococcus equipercicus]KAA1042350.1 DUF418 domain-containing protein [Macrococcus equipercicus]UTH14235.1 DUF418 domain-containing protein [Macrococcus equipercicus]
MTKERIYSLDVLRGFSLFGIIIMNIVGFTHDTFHMNPYLIFRHGWDRVLYSIEVLFVQNSFYPIFAFLFGYGLAMMHESAAARGSSFAPIAYRRLSAMIIFGVIHGMLIFSGDILQSYAIVTLVGVLFLFIDRAFSLIAALFLWLLYAALYWVPTLTLALQRPELDYMGSNTQAARHMMAVLNSHDLVKIIQLTGDNFLTYFFVTDADSFLFRATSLLPLILLGMFAKRVRLFERLIRYRKYAVLLAAVFFVSGLAIKSLPLIYYGRFSLDQVGVYSGGIILAAAYVIALVLLSEHATFRTWTAPLSKVGRLSFTTYIMQSILMFIIVYGFQLFGTLNLLETYTIAVLIYLFNIIFAVCYLKKFKQGPLEYIWRKITYLK